MILAFDTSGPHIAVCVLDGDTVCAASFDEMAKGQAEQLFPKIEDALAKAGAAYADITRIGVGTGPGNFTGIRISVSAARGLALSLGVPAIGVTALEAYALDAPQPVVPLVDAKRGNVYAQRFDTDPTEPVFTDAEGANPDGIATVTAQTAAHQIAVAIAKLAAVKSPQDAPPKPFYMRPADAAPSRDTPPRILA